MVCPFMGYGKENHRRDWSGSCQPAGTDCRCKVRMSGLSKVEMSAVICGRGRYGTGANCLEPTRTGPATSAKRDKAEAHHPEGSGPTAKDRRSTHPSIAGCCGATR